MASDPVGPKFDTANAAIFALECAIGEHGTPLRQRVFGLRIALNDARQEWALGFTQAFHCPKCGGVSTGSNGDCAACRSPRVDAAASAAAHPTRPVDVNQPQWPPGYWDGSNSPLKSSTDTPCRHLSRTGIGEDLGVLGKWRCDACGDVEERRPEPTAIKAAHPTRTGRHDLWAEAMRLVGERHAKGDLVELVNWLLARCEAEKKR